MNNKETELTLGVVARSLEGRIQTLEQFKKQLKVMPTDQLVDGYLKVKDYDTRLKKLKEAVRGEIVDPKRGRIFVDESVSVDEKGHRYLAGSSGEELMAQKRMSFVLQEEKAKDLLLEKGLLADATDVVLNVVTHAKAVDVLARIACTLKSHGYGELVKELGTAFVTSSKVNESKVEALVALGKLTIADVGAMFAEKVTYALYESKRDKG